MHVLAPANFKGIWFKPIIFSISINKDHQIAVGNIDQKIPLQKLLLLYSTYTCIYISDMLGYLCINGFGIIVKSVNLGYEVKLLGFFAKMLMERRRFDVKQWDV